MAAIDFTLIELEDLVTHYVGSKMREEELRLSNAPSNVSEESINYLLKYFILPIKTEEVYHFHHAVKLEMNPVYQLVAEIFNEPSLLVEHSQGIAKILYQCALHPKIAEGKLNIAHFSNIEIDNELVNAIGIFKSETDAPFLKMEELEKKFSISHDFGFEIKGIDKACLIFNTQKDSGFRLVLLDPTKASNDARYWSDDFLQIKPVSNEYLQTNHIMGITKKFVAEKIIEDVPMPRTDQIEMLNRAAGYFKENEAFNQASFEAEVLVEEPIINSFKNFKDDYKQAHQIELEENFELSNVAVKKQSKVFKSVLKLDKNFHVYIHGNKNLIEQGREPDGRKFYKLYFDEEH